MKDMRTNPIPFSYWVCLAVVMALVWILGSEVAKSAEIGDVGFITEQTNICYTDRIVPKTVDALEQWSALAEKLKAVGGEVYKLSEADIALGMELGQWCATPAKGYPIVLFEVDGDYALAIWEYTLEFCTPTFIIRLRDFQAGGLL